MCYQPQIVHFAGHGSPDGRLLFENGADEAVAVHAKVLTKSVDCVVGMPHAVSDAAAIHFVAGFYRTLGEGGSVQHAYDLGCGQLLAAGGEEKVIKKLLPRLLTKAGVAADMVDW